MNHRTCPVCGAEVAPNAAFCTKCGAAVLREGAAQADADPSIWSVSTDSENTVPSTPAGAAADTHKAQSAPSADNGKIGSDHPYTGPDSYEQAAAPYTPQQAVHKQPVDRSEKIGSDHPYTGPGSYGQAQGQPPYGQAQGQAPYGQAQGQAPYGQAQGQAPYGQAQGQAPYGQAQGQAPYGQAQGQAPYGQAQGQAPYGQAQGQAPYGQAQGQAPYGQAQGQAPYGQAQGQAPYGQAPYGGNYGQPPYYGGYGPNGFQPMVGWPVRNKIVAGVLAILLGSLGIHKFYLGKTGVGVAYLLISLLTFGIGAAVMGVISLVEGIIYLCESDEEFMRKNQVRIG